MCLSGSCLDGWVISGRELQVEKSSTATALDKTNKDGRLKMENFLSQKLCSIDSGKKRYAFSSRNEDVNLCPFIAIPQNINL